MDDASIRGASFQNLTEMLEPAAKVSNAWRHDERDHDRFTGFRLILDPTPWVLS